MTQDDHLMQRLKALPKEQMPSRDLWPGIASALYAQQQPSKKSYVSMLASAASLVLVAMLAWFSFESGKSLQGQALVASLSQQHQMQRESLLVHYKDQAALTENLHQQLEELDEAAAAIKKALEQEPNSPALLKMLKHVYEQQLKLIERVHAPRWSTL